ncbi:MAG: hypothetical protein ACFFAM_19935 [Promethearchaeota archaeon]
MEKPQNQYQHVIDELTSYIRGVINEQEHPLGLSIALTNDQKII